MTVGQLPAKELVESMADKLSEIKAKTLALPLIDAVADTLAEEKAEALLYCLGDTVAVAEGEKLYKTLSNIKAKTLVKVLLDTLARNLRPKQLLTHRAKLKQRRCYRRWLTCCLRLRPRH